MEKHLEDLLVRNWSQTELSREFSIFEEDSEPVGQYPTDAGPFDILAVSKDRKRLLVVELKRGRVSDVVVVQILRYMGYVKEQIAEPDQTVEGAIIALDDDQKLRWLRAAVPVDRVLPLSDQLQAGAGLSPKGCAGGEDLQLSWRWVTDARANGYR